MYVDEKWAQVITIPQTIESKIEKIKNWNKEATECAEVSKEAGRTCSQYCSEAMAMAYKFCYELLEKKD